MKNKTQKHLVKNYLICKIYLFREKNVFRKHEITFEARFIFLIFWKSDSDSTQNSMSETAKKLIDVCFSLFYGLRSGCEI